MQDKTIVFIMQIFEEWKAAEHVVEGSHPDEEVVACFIEQKLEAKENQRVKAHLIRCDTCMESVLLGMKIGKEEPEYVPQELLAAAKELANQSSRESALEIVIRAKEKIIEVIRATGDILSGQEFVPAVVLRSRSIKDFKDELVVLKDFRNIRVESKIEAKGQGYFNLSVLVKDKQAQRVIKDIRVTLLRDDVELESCMADAGIAVFEHVLLGKYVIEVNSVSEKLATIILQIQA